MPSSEESEFRFGRLKKLCKSYKLDHKKFDEILALLTNEHIRTSSLTDDDEKYYKACEKSSLWNL